MYYVIRFMKGHLQISLTGLSKERFLNLCRNHQIYLWNIQYHEKQENMIANIQLYDYFKMISILKKTGTRATVHKKYGFPFYLPLFQKKFLLILSVLFICFLLFLSSTYIWAFSFYGNHNVTNEELMDFLERKDIIRGIKKKEIPIESLVMDLRDTFPVITWVSIKIKGTHCMIYMQENLHPVPITKKSSFSNLISDHEGVIISMVTRKGIPKVKVGDSITPDMILVEGNVPVFNEAGEVESEQYYEADADIYIKTTEHFHMRKKRGYEKKIYTGKTFHKLQLQLGSFHVTLPVSFPFFSGFDMYTRTVEKEQVRFFSDFYLPVYRSKILEEEYHLEQKEYSDLEMEKILTNEVNKFILCLQEKGVQIIRKDVKIKKNVAFSEVKADFVTIEQVGIQESN